MIKMASCQEDVREKTGHFWLGFSLHHAQKDGVIENEWLGGGLPWAEARRKEGRVPAIFLVIILYTEENKKRCGKKPGHV